MMKIGAPRSRYYHACYWMTKLMLLGSDEKQRCVILHGKPGGGKTRLAKYTAGIFDTHWKNETKGIYDEKISREEAHMQLLVMNEANMYRLFSKSKGLPMMKRLMEGGGASLENKYGHPFTGFLDVYTLITCNSLPCPFARPVSSNSGFAEEELQIEKEAMEERSVLVEFTKKFCESGMSSFEETEWA